MEIIRTSTGGFKMFNEGYIYTKSVIRKNKAWWKCSAKSTFGCRASLSTLLDHTNPLPSQPHNHLADQTHLSYVKYRSDMRNQATTSLDKPAQIYAQTVAEMPVETQILLPTEENVKRNLRYHRHTPPVPQNLAEFVLSIYLEAHQVVSERKCNHSDHDRPDFRRKPS